MTCFNLYQLSQLIQEPTRVTHTTNSAIDLLFTSQPELITESGVLPIVISDHYLIYGIHEWDKPKQKGDCIKVRSFVNMNHETFGDDLSADPWYHVLNCENVDDAWSLWHSTFMTIVNLHVPERKTKRVRDASLPWLSTEIVHLMRERDRIHKMARRSCSSDDWDSYKKLRNMVTSKIRSEKSNYYISAIESNKGDSPQQQKASSQLYRNRWWLVNIILDGPIDIANAFNEHFSTIAERMASSSSSAQKSHSAMSDGGDFSTPVTDYRHERKFLLSEVT